MARPRTGGSQSDSPEIAARVPWRSPRRQSRPAMPSILLTSEGFRSSMTVSGAGRSLASTRIGMGVA